MNSELKRIGDLLETLIEVLRERPATARRPLTTAQLEQRRAAARSRTTAPDTGQLPGCDRAPTAPLPAVVKPPSVPTVRSPVPAQNVVHGLIGAYVRAWQARYRTKARPDITPAIGVFRRLLKERPAEQLAELIQVFCQMDDPWFQTKHHDIATFGANVGKVAIARDKGYERPNGERHWMEIHEERTKQ